MGEKKTSTSRDSPVQGAVSALESHTGFWLRFVSNHVSARFEASLAAEDISLSEWVALRSLFDTGASDPAALMRELGILWQTGAISPSHEHFITNLVKQKIHSQTELSQRAQTAQQNDKIFVLFLPENEIHELGILYLNYHILTKGYKTIFLGQSLPTESLETLFTFSTTLNFVTYLTVEPNKNEIMDYLNDFHRRILNDTNSKLLIFGPMQVEIDLGKMPEKIELFRSIDAFNVRYFQENIFV